MKRKSRTENLILIRVIKVTGRLCLISFLWIIFIRPSFAQDYSQIDTTLTLQQDILRNEQAKIILNMVNKVLMEIPPQIPAPIERTLSLYLLDVIFNDVYAPFRPPVKEYLQNRIKNVAEEIENTMVEDGAIIWKLYNHGFIVSTKEVTIAFDLIRPSKRFAHFSADYNEIESIIKKCDALLISHEHPDHADEWVAQTFLNQGKPVVTPPDVWKDQPFYKMITHLDRDPHLLHTLSVQSGKRKLKIGIYPGHQGEVLNNISVVYTPDGYCFSHNGDQNFGKAALDTLFIRDIKNHHEIDILMYNQYMSNLWIKGFNPKLVVTGHENEMSHGIHSRHAYWKYDKKLQAIPYPYISMTWGEKYQYFKNHKNQ